MQLKGYSILNTNAEVKDAIMTYGAVVASVNADPMQADTWSNYCTAAESSTINHAITLVGWCPCHVSIQIERDRGYSWCPFGVAWPTCVCVNSHLGINEMHSPGRMTAGAPWMTVVFFYCRVKCNDSVLLPCAHIRCPII